MNVIHFVSEEDNVICIIQVSEVVVAQWETSSGGNSLHNPVNCTADQSRGENAALSASQRNIENTISRPIGYQSLCWSHIYTKLGADQT